MIKNSFLEDVNLNILFFFYTRFSCTHMIFISILAVIQPRFNNPEHYKYFAVEKTTNLMTFFI